MKHQEKVGIPEWLSHLPVWRGFPVPYFVARQEATGKNDWDLRIMDPKRVWYAHNNKLCDICGETIADNDLWFLTGPIGFSNKASLHGAAHKRCMDYSIKICPYLFFEAPDRRSAGLEELGVTLKLDWLSLSKPSMFIMIRASSWTPHPDDPGVNEVGYPYLYTYEPEEGFFYIYEKGSLNLKGKITKEDIEHFQQINFI